MQFTIQVTIEDDSRNTVTEDALSIDHDLEDGLMGLSLLESKRLLKRVQQLVVTRKMEEYTQDHRCCPHCQRKRRIKGYYPIQYRTLFGIVPIPNLRLYRCECEEATGRTFGVLNERLPDHNCPELRYIEAKWASLMSYGLTVDLLKDVLPVSDSLNAETVRQHLHKIAHRQDLELCGQPDHVDGCQRDWVALPRPDKPLTVGIDGGYVRDCRDRKNHFEVIVAKSLSKTRKPKRMGFVQKLDKRPARRLMAMLDRHGLQANQQITFLSDGADNLRDLQFNMNPEAEHVLDWFHCAMRFTVLGQFAKGLTSTDPEPGEEVAGLLESAKWYLWHGNVVRTLETLEESYMICEDESIHYSKQAKLLKHLDELWTYISNNRLMIPNYGEKYRYGEAITTAFVESTVNEVIAKRMVKKQQMQWSPAGAHHLLQTRTAVLNDELRETFERWHPEMGHRVADTNYEEPLPMAA